ncbi:MAG: MucB/RseB C-terminal domain-containing protein [Gammaproteobacteria bacterium]|nr:MucB/RseB C-terminal domain-containing protein [Gammaproteobacteria bacterium]
MTADSGVDAGGRRCRHAARCCGAPVRGVARRFSRFNPFRLAGLTGLLLAGLAESAGADPEAWLMKINHAAASVSFSGVFVNAYDGELEATHVVHRVKDQMLQERFYSLNGETREVVRDKDHIWCYMPDQKVGVLDSRQSLQRGFPRIEVGDLERIKRNYRFTEAGTERIADRMAQRIDVTPNDDFRYGYHLWADLETGLLLRSDLVGRDRRVMEKYLFVTIDFDSEISDQDLQAVTSKDQLKWYGRDAPPVSAAPAGGASGESNWQFSQLPAGYRLNKRIRRMSPVGGWEIEHLIWSDGLSTLSVFIKPAGSGHASVREGLTRMGAVQAYRRTIGDYRVTVMGEVPARTVEFFATGMVYAR